jgi:hypothetical protein
MEQVLDLFTIAFIKVRNNCIGLLFIKFVNILDKVCRIIRLKTLDCFSQLFCREKADRLISKFVC